VRLQPSCRRFRFPMARAPAAGFENDFLALQCVNPGV
jgi:hypothetical protein